MLVGFTAKNVPAYGSGVLQGLEAVVGVSLSEECARKKDKEKQGK
jgi:hypothetical protein